MDKTKDMKISIITINYNNKDGLDKTIESVRFQDYSNIEYIVIDGGSTDGSKEVILTNEDIISHWVSEPDNGIYNAMNKGIEHATGEYCIFMNSGDCFSNAESINAMVKQGKGSDLICGNTFMGDNKIYPPSDITFERLFNRAICHQCCFIKTSLMKKYGYDEKYKIVADRKFFLQALIFENCTYESIDADVVNYDITGFSSMNPVASRLEYSRVLEELIPERIRLDYGRAAKGALYGDTAYHKLFAEIALRQYRKPIYKMTVFLLRAIALFKKSASFVYDFPKTTK